MIKGNNLTVMEKSRKDYLKRLADDKVSNLLLSVIVY